MKIHLLGNEENPMNEGDDKNERIKARAHQIWQSEGKPEGQEAKHWERAELEIMREDAKPDVASADK